MSYRPPFQVSAAAIRTIAEIAALLERYAVRMDRSGALKLRRVNRVRTIQATLAIEGNGLSEEQVSEILDGKRVAGPLREIQEVRNAIAVYDAAQTFDPFSISDLLKAHGIMMAALTDEAGAFRKGGAGVVRGEEVIHMAPPANRVPELMRDLFAWLRTSEDHPLIQSCVFHYELEFIHPFADGNGRMGRLWQSVILGKWHPTFRQLPVETMVFANQARYYQAINESSAANDSGIFLEFMLGEILHALRKRQSAPHAGEKKTGPELCNRILRAIRKTPGIRSGALAAQFDVSSRTVERCLQELKHKGLIEFRGAPRNGGYYPKDNGA